MTDLKMTLDLRLFAVLAPVLLVGCYESRLPGDRCAAEQVCFNTDALGCCTSGSTRVSICDECPAGTTTRTSCRTAGCEPVCGDPPTCRLDMGSGCCGDVVFNESCESCPPGTVDASLCTADSPGECGCGDMLGPIMPPGAPPFEPDVPETFCFTDLGGGCCGDSVTTEDPMCGCPAGTIPEPGCIFPGDGLFPARCSEDFGGGCCGDLVEANGCGFCPAGTIPTELCGATLDGAGDRAPEPAPPGDAGPGDAGPGDAGPGDPRPGDAGVPLPTCHVDLGGGRCGCAVFEALDACGQCPAGSTTACDIIDCLMM